MILRTGIRLAQLAAAAGLAVALAPAAALASAAPAANGGWSVQSVPVPQAKFALFHSVSCARAGTCAAVGVSRRQGESARVLIETSSNGAWSDSHAPQPGNGGAAVLQSVSCPVAGFCMTVGHVAGSGGGVSPVSEVWNGTTWRMGGAVGVGGSSVLNAVSCVSATFCIAVGTSSQQTTVGGVRTVITHPLIERWGGGGWSVVPNAPLTTRGQLSSVSCTSQDVCIALGTARLNGSNTFPVAARWTGTGVRLMTALGLAANQKDISCASVSWCMTAGTSAHGPHQAVSQRWNGHTWKTFAPGQPGVLRGVSCTSNRACTAVGTSGRGSFAADWNGVSWSLTALPSGRSWTRSALVSVDCTPAGHCTAAGSATRAGGQQIPAVLVRR
jgi:hypothetical protein